MSWFIICRAHLLRVGVGPALSLPSVAVPLDPLPLVPLGPCKIHDQAAAVTTKSWPAEYPKWLFYHGHKGKVPTLDLHRHLGSRSKLRCE